jgi:hypothetical protein
MLKEVARFSGIAMWLAGCIMGSGLGADNSTSVSPEFRQVFDLIGQNLTDVSEADMNRAATEGLVAKLAPRVILVRSNETTAPLSLGLTRSNLFDSSVLYLRIGAVSPGLEQLVKSAWDLFSASNKLAGVVLDLRYANGEDYPTAAAVSRLFIQTKQPLLDWGEGMAESKEGGAIGTCPVRHIGESRHKWSCRSACCRTPRGRQGVGFGQLPDSREGGCVEGIFIGKWGPLANHDPRDTPWRRFPNGRDWGGP